MRVRVSLNIVVLLLTFCASSQKSFVRTYYDKWFPNNIYLKYEGVKKEKDSLQKLNDSLFSVQSLAIEKINALKKESVQLKGDLLTEQTEKRLLFDSLSLVKKSLEDSIKSLQFYIITCTEETLQHGKDDLPEIVNTCSWRDYIFIERGKPDQKGRYSWQSELYKLEVKKESLFEVKKLFNPNKLDELVEIINQRLNEDFLSLKETEPVCFDRKRTFVPFKFDDMRITLSENGGMHFEVNYMLPEICFELSAASVNFTMKEIIPFLAEN